MPGGVDTEAAALAEERAAKLKEREERALERGRRAGGAFLVACLILAVAVSFAYALSPWGPLERGTWRLALWLALFGLILGVFMGGGWTFSGHWAGVFISRQNRLSLSQAQLVLWTVLFSSSALALFLVVLRDGVGDGGLGFEVPVEAPALMGISAVSFGAAAAVKSAKRTAEARTDDGVKAKRSFVKNRMGRLKSRYAAALDGPASRKRALQDLEPLDYQEVRKAWAAPLASAAQGSGSAAARKASAAPEAPRAARSFAAWADREWDQRQDGLLFRNLHPGEARPRDLIEGDELVNAAHLDLGKLQVLGFTLLLLVAYMVLVGRMFLHGGLPDALGACAAEVCLDHLPALSDGLVGILGASHLGYLGTKVAGPTRKAT